MQGKPVEINPSIGHGFKIMSVDEWAARWKHNDDPVFADCLNCGGKNTKEHAFTQTWCRGKKKWDSECLCLDCHMFSRRQYTDPDFKTPEEYEKERVVEEKNEAAELKRNAMADAARRRVAERSAMVEKLASMESVEGAI